MPTLSRLRSAVGRLMSSRYAQRGLAAAVALALLITLVAVNPGPRKVGTTAGSDEGASQVGAGASGLSTDVAAADAGSVDSSSASPGAGGSSARGGTRGTTKPADGAEAGSRGARSGGAASGSSASPSGGGSSGGSDGASSGGGSDGQPGGGSGGAGECGFDGCKSTRGVTDNEILLGVRWDPDNKAEYQSGQFPIHFGDPAKMARAMELDINRRNPEGINGRKVRVVLYPDPQNPQQGPAGETTDQAETRYCVKFAEDLKVFAVATHWVGRVGAQCYADRRTLVFRTGAQTSIGDDARLKQIHPWVWTPPEKSINRLWSTLIPELKAQGYFDRRPGRPEDAPDKPIKVGIVLQDDPMYTGVRDLIHQKLRDAGVPTPIEEFRYGTTGDFDFGALQAHGTAAANQFRAKEVNRVLFVPGFLIFNFFMSQAEIGPSPYRPRYAVDSTMVLNGPIEKGVPNFTTDPEQLVGAMGIGWKRQSDVSGMGAGPYTAREQQCVDAMTRGGYPAADIKDRGTPVLLQQHCETFWAFEEAAKRAGRGLTAGTLVGGVQGLGSSWESLLSFNVDFGRAAARGAGDASFGHQWVQWVKYATNPDKYRFQYVGGARPDR